MYTRVILQQVDLDTCLTGLLLGVGASDRVTVARDGATPAELAAPDVLCIEAGGSGETERNNFDHHDRGGSWPPACVQALRIAGPVGSPATERLVTYVAEVDLGRGAGERRPADERPGLSGVFSGMRLTVDDPKEQFFEGMRLLRTVVREGLDPFGPMPRRPEWEPYVDAHRRERASLESMMRSAERFTTRGGHMAGFLRTDRVGAPGALYALGCDIAIAYAPAFRPPAGGAPIPKFTIGGRDGLRVDGLLESLAEHEAGWGGPAHGTIIASPRRGTGLDPEDVKRLVREHF